jgi:hypothetical protein
VIGARILGRALLQAVEHARIGGLIAGDEGRDPELTERGQAHLFLVIAALRAVAIDDRAVHIDVVIDDRGRFLQRRDGAVPGGRAFVDAAEAGHRQDGLAVILEHRAFQALERQHVEHVGRCGKHFDDRAPHVLLGEGLRIFCDGDEVRGHLSGLLCGAAVGVFRGIFAPLRETHAVVFFV